MLMLHKEVSINKIRTAASPLFRKGRGQRNHSPAIFFYKIYFKLNVGGKFRFAGYDMEQAMSRYGNQYIDYHIEFFGNGLNAVTKKSKLP